MNNKMNNELYGIHPLTPLHTEMRVRSALKRRKIYLSDEVDRESLFEVLYYLDKIEYEDKKNKIKNPEPIEIVINSYGGIIYDGLAVVSKMEHLIREKYEIITTVTGYAMSMAFMIAISGTKRIAYKHSTLLFHQPSSGSYGDLQSQEEQVAETQRLWTLMKNIAKEKTKMTDELMDDIKTKKIDKVFTSEQSLNLGIIDEIL